MKVNNIPYPILRNQKGATAVLVAVTLLVLLAFASLALDLSHQFVVRNELQNSADAGALAGARFLYNDDGQSINTNANQIAFDAAIANKSEKLATEVNWNGGNTGDVERGHWSFATRTFTPNASTEPVSLWNVSSEELDANTDFINAVRVTARRQSTPVPSILSQIFGTDSFQRQASAIAYIGFAGSLRRQDVDQPIAICKESILNNGEYDCSVGRMINSGQNEATNETGGWTSFNQDDPCTGGTNAQEVQSLVCGGGNPELLSLGGNMATNGGQIQSAFSQLISCWQGETGRTQSWTMTLPVVNCPGNNVGTCQELAGAVTVRVVWITDAGGDPGYNDAPTQMDDWSNNDPDGQARWNSFVSHFNLRNVDGSPAPYIKKSIYFMPDCTYHEPVGVSGGENFGLLAKIPVLVD